MSPLNPQTAPHCLVAAALVLAVAQPEAIRAQAQSSGSQTAPGWRVKFEGSGSRAVIVEGVLYAGSADGAVYAVDPATGSTKWRFQTGEQLSPATSSAQVVTRIDEAQRLADALATQGRRRVDMAPAVANGTVYVGSRDRSFYAIDAATGKKKWSYEAGGGMVPDNDRGRPFPAALLTGRVVSFVTDGGLHAVDAQTGERKWFLKNLVEPWNGPVLGNGVIFVTTGAVLHAVDWESGEAKWVARVDGSNVTSITAPVTARGLVFFATVNGSTKQATLYAVDAADGQVKWSAAPQPVFETPIIVTAGEAVYLATSGRVLALTMEAGRELWSFRADSIDAGVWADDRHLYVPTHKGSLERPSDTLHALALSTGEEKWSKGVRGSASVSLIHDGVVYAGREPVFALDAATGRQLWSTKGLGSAQLIYSGKLFSISETVSYFGTNNVDQGYLSAVDAKTGKLAPSK